MMLNKKKRYKKKHYKKLKSIENSISPGDHCTKYFGAHKLHNTPGSVMEKVAWHETCCRSSCKGG